MHWIDFDLDKTIKDFEYTRKAALDINHIMDSEEYENQSAEMIYDYLLYKTKEISFKDYLRRYIYHMAEIEEDFSKIEEEEYKEIIKLSFEERKAPYFFRPTSRKVGKIIKDFVNSDHVKRETIFVLGFGLSMSDTDVCEFLTKVNLEHSIDFQNYEEVIYWYCYRYDLNYGYAKSMMKFYEELHTDDSLSQEMWQDLLRSPKLYLTSENELILYLKHLKTFGEGSRKDDLIYQEFEQLYERAIAAITNEYNRNGDGKRVYTAQEIAPGDIEKILCSGIPMDENGNLMKMSSSTLAGRFANKRMARQRIASILQRKHTVERFDLTSLLFLIYALEVEPDWPAERYLRYIEEMGEILGRCDMEGVYPANPYEAFILMCLISEYPLLVYADVLAMSFEEA